MYRQGDVLLVPIPSVPSEATEVQGWDGILVKGEATGHAHRVSPTAARLFRHDDQMCMVVDALTPFLHEEHNPIPLSSRSYEVIRQREYSPERIRNVVD